MNAKTAHDHLSELEELARRIEARFVKRKIEGVPFPDTHEPFGWDLKPTYDWED